jgi:ribonuclease VapC
MIAVDSSAIVAIVFDEPERPSFAAAIDEATTVLISSVSVVETKMVLHYRWGMRAVLLADDLFGLPQFEIMAPSLADMEAAFAAFVLYGKGSGHPASLNFDDVFSYALAKVRNLPLLFKGNGFSETDLRSAVPKASH